MLPLAKSRPGPLYRATFGPLACCVTRTVVFGVADAAPLLPIFLATAADATPLCRSGLAPFHAM